MTQPASRISPTANCGSTSTLSRGRYSKNGRGTLLVLTVMSGGSSVGTSVAVAPSPRVTLEALRVLYSTCFQLYPHFHMPVPRWAIVSRPHLVWVLKLQSRMMYENRIVFASVMTCEVPGIGRRIIGGSS